MFCKNCGKSLEEDENFCKNCGYLTVDLNDLTPEDLKELSDIANNQNSQQPVNAKPVEQKNGSSKKGMGILLGIFTGVIGLIIGICIFQNEYERKTFVNGWLIAFFIELAISALILISYFAFFGSMINTYM